MNYGGVARDEIQHRLAGLSYLLPSQRLAMWILGWPFTKFQAARYAAIHKGITGEDLWDQCAKHIQRRIGLDIHSGWVNGCLTKVVGVVHVRRAKNARRVVNKAATRLRPGRLRWIRRLLFADQEEPDWFQREHGPLYSQPFDTVVDDDGDAGYTKPAPLKELLFEPSESQAGYGLLKVRTNYRNKEDAFDLPKLKDEDIINALRSPDKSLKQHR